MLRISHVEHKEVRADPPLRGELFLIVNAHDASHHYTINLSTAGARLYLNIIPLRRRGRVGDWSRYALRVCSLGEARHDDIVVLQ